MFKVLALSTFLLVASPLQEGPVRNVAVDCSLDGGKSCKLSREDMQWIYEQHQLLSEAVIVLSKQKNCGSKDI